MIDPCTGSWTVYVVLVTKKGASTKFCVDHRKLNEVMRMALTCHLEATAVWMHCRDHTTSAPGIYMLHLYL